MAETTPETTDGRGRRPSVRAALVAAAIVSAGTLLLATFELSMADWPSGLVLLGILPLTALLFFGCCVWTATLLLRIRKDGVKFALPFLICAATLALLQYAPLQQDRPAAEFLLAPRRSRTDRGPRRGRRTQAQCRLQREPDRARRQASPTFPPAVTTSSSTRPTEGTYVLFLTSRGLKHYFTGFLHVPPGGDPKNFFEFDDKPPSQLVRYDKDWYFVAN